MYLFDRALPLIETPFHSFNSVSKVSSRASKSLDPKESADHDNLPSLTADMTAEPVSLMSFYLSAQNSYYSCCFGKQLLCCPLAKSVKIQVVE